MSQRGGINYGFDTKALINTYVNEKDSALVVTNSASENWWAIDSELSLTTYLLHYPVCNTAFKAISYENFLLFPSDLYLIIFPFKPH